MRDIEAELRRRMECWNVRFRACWEGKYTQEQLAKALNERYQTTSFTQKAINRLMHLGETGIGKDGRIKYKGLKGFPEYETMLKIADFFGVDVGYLTGETDAESFTEEKASSYLGLSTAAIKVIKNATGNDRFLSTLMFVPTETVRRLFNNLLTAKQFPEFMEALAELASVYEDPDKEKRLWEEAEKRFGKELLSEAIEHRDDTEEDNPDPSPELIEAIHTVNDIIDQGYETEQRNELYHDVFRFRLLRVYNRLVDELYPPYSGQ